MGQVMLLGCLHHSERLELQPVGLLVLGLLENSTKVVLLQVLGWLKVQMQPGERLIRSLV
ncbi:MAG: hypothetical protein CMI67_17820 [Pelagibaca sp.]|nr:hypothetical protein [Pelagibaca sp.]